MSAAYTITRRDFIERAGTLAAGLVIAIHLPGAERWSELDGSASDPFAPNAWLRINADDSILAMVDRSEMGQGVATSLPMLIAEELEADWSKIRIEFAPAAKEYANRIFGTQGTGGSTSIRAAFVPMRQAGAAAREMLIAAAASTWGVDRGTCKAERGTVVHAASGKRLTYGALVATALAMPVPAEVPLKDPKDWTIIGTRVLRLDTRPKVTGQAGFGIDVKMPGLLTAVVARCPVFGGKVKSFDAAKASAMPGVKRVVEISTGVAVIAETFWQAKSARDALQITWDEGANANNSSGAIASAMTARSKEPCANARKDGDPAAVLASAPTARTLDVVYELPFLAHSPMEPLNATAYVRSDGVDIWVGTQFQTTTQNTGARIGGVPPEKVRVHTTFLGGGFGRRAGQDFVSEALEASKAVGAPVKVMWTREDDTQHGSYRPISRHAMRAALDPSGAPAAWTHQVIAPSIRAGWPPKPLPNGLDGEAVEGAVGMPYDIAAVNVEYATLDAGVPITFWRSVNNSFNAFAVETFIDELAHAAKKDPFEYRRALLSKAPRHLRVLELAAEKGDWGKALPAGRARGIAVAKAFGSYVAQVAEVSVDGGKIRVHRVTCAFDCGPVVNPLTVEAQAQGAIVYGLTAALYGDITIAKGRVVQSNFNDYPMLRLREMPVVDVHIVQTQDAQGGVGEPGTPPIAPAVGNAIFALTGKRLRALPFRIA